MQAVDRVIEQLPSAHPREPAPGKSEPPGKPVFAAAAPPREPFDLVAEARAHTHFAKPPFEGHGGGERPSSPHCPPPTSAQVAVAAPNPNPNRNPIVTLTLTLTLTLHPNPSP